MLAGSLKARSFSLCLVCISLLEVFPSATAATLLRGDVDLILAREEKRTPKFARKLVSKLQGIGKPKEKEVPAASGQSAQSEQGSRISGKEAGQVAGQDPFHAALTCFCDLITKLDSPGYVTEGSVPSSPTASSQTVQVSLYAHESLA